MREQNIKAFFSHKTNRWSICAKLLLTGCWWIEEEPPPPPPSWLSKFSSEFAVPACVQLAAPPFSAAAMLEVEPAELELCSRCFCFLVAILGAKQLYTCNKK
jgi:hypothetical protein